MFGFGLSTTFKWIAFLLIIIICAGSIYYVINMKSSLVISEQNNKILKDSITSQDEVIKKMQSEVTQINQINDKLNKNKVMYQKDVQTLSEKFTVKANGQSQDLGYLARSKPALINKIIDKTTEDSNRCVELMTGAKLKEGEKNDQCQEFINSITK